MSNDSSDVLQQTRHLAASRFRQLVDEIHMLMVSFPDLRDAFDADELPIAFILRRDSQRSDSEFKRKEPLGASTDDATDRQIRATRRVPRFGRRKQPADE
jgi:hypothetical protein